MPGAFIVFFVGAGACLPFGFMATLAYDRLARRLHDQHPEAWKAAGGPAGFFWRPPAGIPPGALTAFLKAFMTWAFRMPAALRNDLASKRDQALFRIGLVPWNGGVIALFAFILIRYGFPPWQE
jgi:hypothetical protein